MKHTLQKVTCPACACAFTVAHPRDLQKEDMPTPKQFDAFRLVFIAGLDQQAAAAVMGLSQAAISRLLARLKTRMPWIFPKKTLHRAKLQKPVNKQLTPKKRGAM